MGAKMRDYFSRRLDDVKLAVLMVDGIEVARHTVVVALGITEDGTKEPLGLWQGPLRTPPCVRRCCRT
jgi:transposase-like protein